MKCPIVLFCRPERNDGESPECPNPLAITHYLLSFMVAIDDFPAIDVLFRVEFPVLVTPTIPCIVFTMDNELSALVKRSRHGLTIGF